MMLRIRARFYGIRCWASIENGIPTLTGTGYFNKKALTFVTRFHQFLCWITGISIPLPITFEED
jgi:hypothetical protein